MNFMFDSCPIKLSAPLHKPVQKKIWHNVSTHNALKHILSDSFPLCRFLIPSDSGTKMRTDT